MILQGKTVIVCGVGEGLGSEIARLCLRDGANVMLAARTVATLEKLAKDLDPAGERVAYQATDISNRAQCDALAKAAVDRFGGVDALAQVAAFDGVFGGFLEVTPEDWRKTIEINVIGTTQVVQSVVPSMHESKTPRSCNHRKRKEVVPPELAR